MRLLVTRPEADAKLLSDKLKVMGHEVDCLPLLRIVHLESVNISSEAYQLVCATSANAFTYPRLPHHIKQTRVLTVGPQSLAAAHATGFAKAEARGGDVHGMVAYIRGNFDPAHGPILYLAGAEVSADLQKLLQAAGFTVEKHVLYEAVAETHADLADALGHADGVLLYSPRTARIWLELVTRAQLLGMAARPSYFCLSANVAQILPKDWQTHVAKTPDEAAMLTLLDRTPRSS